jgi:hypothetical protein
VVAVGRNQFKLKGAKNDFRNIRQRKQRMFHYHKWLKSAGIDVIPTATAYLGYLSLFIVSLFSCLCEKKKKKEISPTS